MGFLSNVVVIVVVVVTPPNVANSNCSIILPIVSIGIRKTRNTRKKVMVAPIVAIKSKEKQGTTMAIDTIDAQILIGAYG
jgi:hypothetical protein